MNKTGCYINRFCLSWTILVGKSPCFVCCEQYWLLYIPGLCAMNKNWLVYQPVLSFVDKISWYINRFCLSWTILGGTFHGCVLLGQYWLVNQPFFSFFHGQ